MSAPKPTAAGSLKTTPFPHLLVYALDRRLSGTLVLEAPGGKKSALALVGGAPMKAKTAEPVIFLGRLMLELGVIDEKTHNRTLSRVAKEQRRHGQILLEEGALDEETLEAGLREQLVRQLTWLFKLPPETAYGYYEGVDFLARWGGPLGGAGKALAVFWRCIRAEADPRIVEATVERLGTGKLKLHPGAQPAHFEFSAHDRAVIDVLRARPHSTAELIATELADPGLLKRILYALAITRHLDVGAEPVGVELGSPAPARAAEAPQAVERQPAPPAEPTVVEPVIAASEGVNEFKRELRERAAAKDQSYYQVLGVAPDAPAPEISAAYFQLAKKLHPDRLGSEYADVKDLATRVFARITEAHQILNDPERRGEYDELLKSGGGSADEQEQVQRVLRAATAFQKAEVLVRKQNLAAAETEILRAVEEDPTQGDYIALKAWIQAQRPDRAMAPVDDLIAELGQVLQRESNNERAHWYRGQLLKRAGKDALAIKDFRWVLDRNPKHLDAAREVRLHEMRKGPGAHPAPAGPARPPPKKPEGPKKDGGILGKFFKR
jgi:DnaJ-domain-containing protein 1